MRNHGWRTYLFCGDVQNVIGDTLKLFHGNLEVQVDLIAEVVHRSSGLATGERHWSSLQWMRTDC